MWPFLCHGRDSVVVESVAPEQVKKGDIVLLRVNENRYLLHRVTKASPDAIETTGDGNCFRDGAFPRSCIAARVAAVIRNGKKSTVTGCPGPCWCSFGWLFFRAENIFLHSGFGSDHTFDGHDMAVLPFCKVVNQWQPEILKHINFLSNT